MSAPLVSNAKRLDKGKLIGVFDVEIGAIRIIGAKLFRKDDGAHWIGFPSKEWTDRNGTKQYAPIIEWSSREASERVQTTLLPIVAEAFR
jgi:hypothetical protein